MAVTRPPKIYRPVYVQYVSSRLCRYNPSYDNIPSNEQAEDLWALWERRHPRRSRPDEKVSLKPRKRKKRA